MNLRISFFCFFFLHSSVFALPTTNQMIAGGALAARSLNALELWRRESAVLNAQKKLEQERVLINDMVNDGDLSDEEAARRIAVLEDKVAQTMRSLHWGHGYNALLGATEEQGSSFNNGLEASLAWGSAGTSLGALDEKRIGKHRFLRAILLLADLMLGGVVLRQPLSVGDPTVDGVKAKAQQLASRVRILKVLRRLIRLWYNYHVMGVEGQQARASLAGQVLSLLSGLSPARQRKVVASHRFTSGNVMDLVTNIPENYDEYLREMLSGHNTQVTRSIYFDEGAPRYQTPEQLAQAAAARAYEKRAKALAGKGNEAIVKMINAESDPTKQREIFYTLLPEGRVDLLAYCYEQDKENIPPVLFGFDHLAFYRGGREEHTPEDLVVYRRKQTEDGFMFRREQQALYDACKAGTVCCICLTSKPNVCIIKVTPKEEGSTSCTLQIKQGDRVAESTEQVRDVSVHYTYETCQHVFCLPCITTWGAKTKNECPQCKMHFNQIVYHPPSVIEAAKARLDAEASEEATDSA